MPALKPATIGQKFLTDCGQNRPLTTLDINEVLKTIPPEMVEDMKKQAEKYGFPFEEYVQSVLGAIVMDPDLGAY